MHNHIISYSATQSGRTAAPHCSLQSQRKFHKQIKFFIHYNYLIYFSYLSAANFVINVC